MFTKEQILGAERIPDAVEMIKTNIRTNAWWAIRAMQAIYARQTADEQNSEATRYDNKVGFGAADAEILSSFAKQVKRWESNPAARKYDMPLSPKQIGMVQRMMPKYSRQLLNVARAKAAQAAQAAPADTSDEDELASV